MSSSSDSEVINRSRRNKKQKRTVSSSSMEDSNELDDYSDYDDDYEPLFREIFGTGREYDYIFQKDSRVPDNESQPERRISRKCYSDYIAWRAPRSVFPEISVDLISKLADGYAPEYLALYCSGYTIREIYYIKGLMDRCERDQMGLHESTQSAKFEERQPGLLTVEEYAANLRARDRVHEPSGKVAEWTNESHQRMAERIAANPVFQAAVGALWEQKVICRESKADGPDEEMLSRLFLLGDGENANSADNKIRRAIIEEACKMAVVDKGEIKARLRSCGYEANEEIEQGNASAGETFKIENAFTDLKNLTNLISSLEGPRGTYAGIFYDKNYCKIAMLGENGDLLERAVFNSSDGEAIRNCVSSAAVVCATANTSQARFFFNALSRPFLYVPSALSLFNDYKEYSVPYNIAFAVQNPYIYFARLAYSADAGFGAELPKGVSSLCVARAVRMALAARKLDWLAMMAHQYKHTLLHTLGISLPQKHFNYAGVASIPELAPALSSIAYASVGTFFTLLDSTHPLDRTGVHPQDYSTAVILCKGAYVSRLATGANAHESREKEDDIVIVASMLENPSALRGLNLGADDSTVALISLRDMLLVPRPAYFTGACDNQIFADIVPELGEQAQGVVAKVGPDYFIVECTSGGQTASVYVRKTDELLLNQLVNVKITGKVLHMLNYSGEISREADYKQIRLSHRLVRNLSQEALQQLMDKEGRSVYVRPSTTPGFYIVVCRLQPGLFHTFRVECFQGPGGSVGVVHDGIYYQGLDDFMAKPVKSFFKTVSAVTNYRHFYRSREEAMAHINSCTNYLGHAVILAEKNPGFMEFLYGNKRVFVRMEPSRLVYKDQEYATIDEFIRFAKTKLNR